MPWKHALGSLFARCAAQAIPSRLLAGRPYFQIWENQGVHAVKADFTSPIPLSSDLDGHRWAEPLFEKGVDYRLADQLRLLDRFSERYGREIDTFPDGPQLDPIQFYFRNGWFEKVDAEILYCLVRDLKPNKVIEVGSGISTRLIAAALTENNRDAPERRGQLLSIEPFPNRLVADQYPGLLKLLVKPVQTVPLEEFQQLDANDILFIDSSHICRTGGDVVFEICEVLPLLKEGVYVHFHDIYLPYEYPELLVRHDRDLYTEQYLLHAFLAFNPLFEVVWASYLMKSRHLDRLKARLRSISVEHLPPERFLPSSIWLRKGAGTRS